MKPVSPVVHGAEAFEIVIAKDQPQYLPLPALPVNNHERVITRWRMSWRERLKVLISGDIYLWVTTFARPLQPVLLTLERPEIQVPTDFPQDPAVDWSMNALGRQRGHRKLAGAMAVILMFLGGCSARKPIAPKPDPRTYSVSVCAPKLTADTPTCTQVIWPETVPDGATCKAVPGTGGTEVIVCELPATGTSCCGSKVCATQHHHDVVQ